MRHWLRTAGYGLGLLIAAAAAAQPARIFPSEANADPVQLERRLAAVGMLLEKSSVATQIDASADPLVKEKRSQALERHRQAKEAYAAKDYPAAAKLLTQAGALAAEAARLSGAKELSENHRAKFDAKMESVKALLAAQQRIGAEKAQTANTAQVSQSVENLMAQANERAGAGRMPEAHALLERAYLLVKASVTTLRAGDTLTRSLNFASKEEEYQYELDRNNTHRMLVKMLLPERHGNAAMEESVNTAVDKAGRVRGEAEQAAKSGDFASGIKLLEDSTRELVRGIRSLGVFIPG